MTLARYAARRLAGGVVFVLIVTAITLLLARLAPGDATTDDSLLQTAEQRAARRAELGLDRSWLAQYGQWLGGVVRLDLGQSSLYHRPVASLVGERARNTAILALAALVLATLIGIPLGRFTGTARGVLAHLARTSSLVVLSLPPLLASLALVFIAAVTGWLPAGGMTSATAQTSWLMDVLRHLPVPVLALALPIAATLERVQSRAMAEAASRPFVHASLARGLSRPEALMVHAWPASLAPVLGVYGVIVASLFSGSFVVEVVTAWPGLGRLLFDALRARDVWLVAGCGATSAAFLAVSTTVVDIVHAALDPRTLGEAE
jgi:peptide/nickel transport system permease protein